MTENPNYEDVDAPEADGDEYEVIIDDTEDDVDGEHPEGDYPQDIYDDDPDEPIDEDDVAVPEDED